jgi:transcription initiation factor IIE alpha subunit
LEVHELAERIARLILDRGYVYDEDISYELGVDEFELVKAKNVLCRYHGIAVERWHKEGEESRQAMFLTREFESDDAAELIHKVFHDPDFKTRRRMKEEERKTEIRGEVKELLDCLQEEWGDLFKRSQPET